MTDASSPSLTPLQRAFLALEEARARVAELESASREPVAIVGLGLRAPGGATDADSFWRLLAESVDAIGPVPSERWPHENYYDPDPDKPGRIASPARRFSYRCRPASMPAFFGISPREADDHGSAAAAAAGPLRWEALENAGQRAGSARTARAPVCSSASPAATTSYLQLESADACCARWTTSASGTAHSIVSVAVCPTLLGLQGPSLADGHGLLVLARRDPPGLCRRCATANAAWLWPAASTSCLVPRPCLSRCRSARMLAPDGRCKSVRQRAADGFARGRRLRDAGAQAAWPTRVRDG